MFYAKQLVWCLLTFAVVIGCSDGTNSTGPNIQLLKVTSVTDSSIDGNFGNFRRDLGEINTIALEDPIPNVKKTQLVVAEPDFSKSEIFIFKLEAIANAAVANVTYVIDRFNDGVFVESIDSSLKVEPSQIDRAFANRITSVSECLQSHTVCFVSVTGTADSIPINSTYDQYLCFRKSGTERLSCSEMSIGRNLNWELRLDVTELAITDRGSAIDFISVVTRGGIGASHENLFEIPNIAYASRPVTCTVSPVQSVGDGC